MKKLTHKPYSPFFKSHHNFHVCIASGISLSRRAGMRIEIRVETFHPQGAWIPQQLSCGQSAVSIISGGQTTDDFCCLHLMKRCKGSVQLSDQHIPSSSVALGTRIPSIKCKHLRLPVRFQPSTALAIPVALMARICELEETTVLPKKKIFKYLTFINSVY